MTDWNNLDPAAHPSDRDAQLIDPFTVSDLLLQVSCNLKIITPETVREELVATIDRTMADALEVFDANTTALVKAAQLDRGNG